MVTRPDADANECGEAWLRDERIWEPVVAYRRRDAGSPRCKVREPGRALDMLSGKHERIRDVVHQDRDPRGVNRCERDLSHGNRRRREWSPLGGWL